MRFSTVSFALVALFFAVLTVVQADSYIEVADANNLVRRADEASSTHNHGSASSTTAAAESTEMASTTYDKSGKSSSAAAAAATTSSSGHSHGDSTTTTTTTSGDNDKASQYGNFASPYILSGGSLFYIGISVTTLLWVTGKIIDVKTERQERYAESLTHRM